MRTTTSYSSSTEADIQIEAPPERRVHWGGTLIVLFLVFTIALATGAAVAATAYYNSDYILPGVHVLAYDLGDQTVDEATQTLARGWAARTIALETTNSSWTVAPDTLGIRLDAAATARRAQQQGRGTTDVNEIMATLRGDRPVIPVWAIDLTAAERNLQAAAPRYAQPAQDAQLQLNGGTVQVLPEQAGVELDVAATVTWLSQYAAQAVLEGRAPLFNRPVPAALTAADLAPLAQQANQWLNNPLPLQLYDPVNNEVTTIDVPPSTWGEWVSLSVTGAAAPPQLSTTVDEDQVAGFLGSGLSQLPAGAYLDTAAADRVAENLTTRLFQADAAPLELRVYHGQRNHAVQPGETMASIAFDYGLPYPWIQQANPDSGDFLAVGQTITIPSPDAFLPLPIVRNKRIIISLNQQRLWAYENGAVKWEWPVSTGIASSPTSPGVYQVQTHEGTAYAGNWDLWMPDFMGIYQPVPGVDFMNGFHGFPTRNGSQLLWTNDLGHPVTYGCVLVSSSNSSLLYEWAETGVIVEIRP